MRNCIFVGWVALLMLVACGGGAAEEENLFLTYVHDPLPPAAETSRAVIAHRALPRWRQFTLTYAFANGSGVLAEDVERRVVGEAFATWQAEAPVAFVEVADPATADIVISWGEGDGAGGSLAQTNLPTPFAAQKVHLQFDAAEKWVDSTFEDVDLFTAALHQIGHALGLEHSRDPNAVMFFRYKGPRRRLNRDDVAALQTLYTIEGEAQLPTIPSAGATAPVAPTADDDGDGIGNEEERFVTATDPAVADSDGDGLADGVEVLHQMNPLNPDMDRDGVSDGDEVAAGTNPFFPDNPTSLEGKRLEEIYAFLERAAQQESVAFRLRDAAVAETVFTPAMQERLNQRIGALNSQSLMRVGQYNPYASYYAAVRVLSQNRLEIDVCRMVASTFYQVRDAAGEALREPVAVRGEGPMLQAQTLSLSRLGVGWRITDRVEHTPPAFCEEMP